MLEAVGLGGLEERLYCLALEQPGTTVDRILEQVDVSRTQALSALDSLEVKGLLSRRAGDDSLVPTSPDVAVAALISRRHEELERVRLAAGQLAERFRSSIQRVSSTSVVEMIQGRESVRMRYEQLELGATKEILSFDRPPYVSPLGLNKLEVAALARGVRCRAIYDTASLEIPGQVQWLEQLVGAGEDARVLARLPLKLLIVDERKGLVPITMDERGVRELALLVHESALLDALVVLFETLWDQAVSVGQALQPRDDEPDTEGDLTPLDRQILVLLAAGLTDEAIAGQLSIGSRTVRRRLSRMMRVLGVQTRFQVGLGAAKRGWL